MEFYLLNFFLLFFDLLFYFYFRTGIEASFYLSKISKSFIKKNLKGTVNFWTYNQMYQKAHMGKFIYYLNLFLLIFLIVYCISSLLFAWIGFMRIPIFVISVIVGILEIPAIFSAMIYKNKKDLGRPVVFLKITKYPGSKGRTAFNIYSIFNFLFCLIPIAYSVFILSDFIYK